MTTDVKVSIITPTFNSARFIAETIQSVQAQTHQNWELLITDDASSDDTVSIVKRFMAKDSRIQLFENTTNSGAAVARNRSIEQATGDYMAFLDSDDLWNPAKLEQQLRFMQENGIEFSFTAYELMNEKGKPLEKQIDVEAKEVVDYKDMLAKKATLGCSTVMLSRNLYQGVRMPDIRTGQDYATWLSILKRGQKAHCLQEVMTRYRIVSTSISRNKYKKALRQWRIYTEIEKLPVLPSAWYFTNSVWRWVAR